MRSEVLDIGYSEVRVAYVFENESDHDVSSVISFPLPLYPAFPSQSGVIAKGQPSDFSVVVDTVSVQFKTRVQAISHGKDVTEQLHSSGLTDSEIANMPFAIDRNLRESNPYKGIITSDQLNSLTKKGLIVDDYLDWMVQVTYQWIQKFPAKSKIAVSHKYKPFVATGTASGYGNERFASRFCMDSKLKEKLDSLSTDEKNLDVFNQLNGTIVAYVLQTANTWKDGIADFTLRIHKGTPEELISLCFPGQFKRTDATTLETHLNNFNPRSDLDIYFANIDKSKYSDNYGIEPQVK